MGAVSFRAKTDLRARLRSAFLLALAIGIAGGATLTALAGARRTHSAVDRFVAYEHPAQVGVAGDPSLYPRIARIPQVTFSARSARFAMLRLDARGRRLRKDTLGTVAIDDLRVSRPIILSGRVPRSDRPDEVAVNASAAKNEHLKVGDTLRFHAYAPAQVNALLEGTHAAPTGPRLLVHVVGIARFPTDLSTAQATPDVSYTGSDTAIFTRAFLRAYGDRVAVAGGIFLVIRLTDDAALPKFAASVSRLSHGKAQTFLGSDDLDAAAQARHATNVEALALLLFGVLAAIVTLTLLAQAFAREVYLDADEYAALGAMGMTRKQLVAAAALRAALISIVGATLAVGVAVLASPRMPIGLARQAEVDPGYSFDAAVLLIGTAAIAAMLTAWTASVSWRATRYLHTTANRQVPGRRHSSRIARALSQAGSPPTATIGTTMAFESGSGAGAVPVHTALASAVVAIAVVAGALTFGANLSRLAEHPRLQGWNWDVAVGNPHSDDVSRTAIPLLGNNPTIAAFSSIAGTEAAGARINGRDSSLFSIDAVKGGGLVPYTGGTPPGGPNEIALGSKTMSDLHVKIGEHVRVSTSEKTLTMRITGRVLLTPSVVNDLVPLGQAAVVTDAAVRALHYEAPVNVFLIRFRANVDRVAALRRLRGDFPGTVLSARRPPDIENLQRVDHLPALLAALFALIALLIVGNMLVSSVRRRRRELAVLRTMGFVRRQVSGVVIWQATMVAIVAIVVGIPVGAAAGRAAWKLVTDRLGLAPDAVVPTTLLVLVALVALVAANVIAIVPGLLATRTPPARILRTE